MSCFNFCLTPTGGLSPDSVPPVEENLEQKSNRESSIHQIVEIMKKKPLSEHSLIICSEGNGLLSGYIKRSCGDWSVCHIKNVIHPKTLWKIPNGEIIVFEHPPKAICKDWESLVERDLYQVICNSRDGSKEYAKFTGVKEAFSVPTQVFLEVFPPESAKSWYSHKEMEMLYLKC